MKTRKRKVQFVANLIFVGEPLLVLLKNKKNFLIAAAVDETDLPGSNFVCVSMTNRNWQKYIDGHVDLRFLFAYPSQRLKYSFSYSDWNGNEIVLSPFEKPFHEELLPSKGLFSREHNNDYGKTNHPTESEELYIDGEWELNEFGRFYQKYADIYAITAALKNIDSTSVPQALQGRTKKAFCERPFKGGSSYLHVFDDLPDCLPRDQRISLDGINYNSPGDVRILGEMSYFAEVELMIRNFLTGRDRSLALYKTLYKILSSEKLLTAPASRFQSTDPRASIILKVARELADEMKFSELEALNKTCENNALVTAKIVLAIYRRLETAALFFAEGRMSFTKA